MTGLETTEAIFLGLDVIEWLAITCGWGAVSEVLGYIKPNKIKANSPSHLVFNLIKSGVQYLAKGKQKTPPNS